MKFNYLIGNAKMISDQRHGTIKAISNGGV